MILVLPGTVTTQTIDVDGALKEVAVVTQYIDLDDAKRLANHRQDRLPSDPYAAESKEIAIPTMDALIAGGVI